MGLSVWDGSVQQGFGVVLGNGKDLAKFAQRAEQNQNPQSKMLVWWFVTSGLRGRSWCVFGGDEGSLEWR